LIYFSNYKMARFRNKERKNQRKYSKDQLKSAIKAVLIDRMKINQAANDYNVPRKTLSDHVKKDQIHDGNVRFNVRSYGNHRKIFNDLQEQQFKDRILMCFMKGFPLTIDCIRESAFEYAKELNRRNFIDKIPESWIKRRTATEDWYYQFKRRHNDLTLRKPEGLSSNRAQAFNKKRVDSYFASLEELGMKDVDPRFIYNMDETGLSSVPSASRKVIAITGAKSVSQIQVGERGTLTTVVPVISAAGDLFPPFIIFKGKRMDQQLRDALSEKGFSASMSGNGYMEKEIFLKFLQFFQKNRCHPEKKCYLVLDGHKTHTFWQAVSYAMENNIELVCIPPHCTHRLQPLDTHWNKPLKDLWQKYLAAFLKETDRVVINRFDFVNLLQKVWNEMVPKRNIVTGAFAHCGLFPLCNVVRDHEYSISESFVSNQVRDEVQTRSIPIIKKIIPSPKKIANDYHQKTHNVLITTEENSKEKKQAVTGKRVKRKQSKTDSEPCTSSPIRLSKLMKKARYDSVCASSQPCASSSSICVPKWIDRTKDGSTCNICGNKWRDNKMLDFLKCISCKKWCCEDCFEVERCALCI